MKKDNAVLITNNSARSPFAEAFRTLRTNISFAGLDAPLKVILITSSGPGEGKSTTSCNLAFVMAQSNQKVLLMDCDLRRPTIHKVFDINDTIGVTNALINDVGPEELAKESELPGLYILPSGPIPPNPAELIGSQRMELLLSRAASKFDCVIIDSSPLNIVTDATLLSTMVDGVVLVIKSAFTRIDAAREAKDKLERAGAKIIGVVLNKIDMSGGDYYYYTYYHQNAGGKQKKKPRIALF